MKKHLTAYHKFCYFFIAILHISYTTIYAQNSVLAQGEWYKITIENPQGGVYKIDRNFLNQLGINTQNINPQNIKIYGNGGGMLPQANTASRPADLIENAIFVKGEADGKFDNEDYVLFYAEGSDKLLYNKDLQFIQHQKNLYDDQNYYFITVGNSAGKRITNVAPITETAQSIDTFDEVDYFEEDRENIVQSGRFWFGNFFNATSQPSFSLKNVTNLAERGNLKLLAQTFASSRLTNPTVEISLNNKKITSINIPITYATGNSAIDKYLPKGNLSEAILTTVNASDFITANGNLNFSLKLDNRGTGSQTDNNAYAHFDFLTVNVQRKLQRYDNFNRFRSLQSLQNLVNEYKIGNITDLQNTQVWDITLPYAIVSPTLKNLANNTASFIAKSNNANELREFLVLQTNLNFPSPKALGKIANQNLCGALVPDLLIITDKRVSKAARKLASFRKQNDKLDTLVVTIDEVYNEFSSGRKDVSAIRDFARFLYNKNKKFKFLLLFGGSSYNYKGQTDYIPTYESSESLHPIWSFASDDYFGLLENNEGAWEEQFSSAETLDIGVGRIPLRISGDNRVAENAEAVVDKIIAYSQGNSMGKWRNKVCFVADNDDDKRGIFQADSENLSQRLENQTPYAKIDKLYLDAFPTKLTANGVISPLVREKLNEEVEKGSLFINFIGHGSETGWTAEKILDQVNASSWTGLGNMPLLMTATCEFGRYDGQLQSGAEVALLNPKGGAIALLTTTRPVYNTNNEVLNRNFIDYIFKPLPDGTMPRLGDLMRIVKNNSMIGTANRNFVLLGDPSMRLAYPQNEAVITKIEVDGKDSQQLTALSKVTISGEIQDKGVLQSNFNGTITATILDKPYNINTLGLIDAKMPYRIQDNLLFEGDATVSNGKFTINFIVPKNIDYRDGEGKIILYAKNNELTKDATGANRQIKVGGSRLNAPIDNIAPTVSMYMDKKTFVSGSRVEKNTTLFVELADANGFNVSSSGLGQDMVVVLNDTLKYLVSKYLTIAKDDFTKGSLAFPLKNLAGGKYKLVFRVWDNYNNATESSLEFTVDNEPFSLTTTVYPNPFSEKITIDFSQNRATDIPVTVDVEIFSAIGQRVYKSNSTNFSSSPEVFSFIWDGKGEGGQLLSEGVYVYKITLKQAIKNGEIAVKSGKMVLLR